ncbi:lactonase family protein [Leifsonia shinshuensis]|uniref:6-phosphogluconolactonase n=1 Tax=Leifsonia shinshuensis TaxID=150026 RepID=A0A853CWY2_9MICO|nr:beta-propeller fold lactonase family protein [Leifsonia shinshuensis]NYJ25616.1 6-phosphogluconolactonase [Leifsonia shinshuensis]
MTDSSTPSSGRLVAFVGSYASGPADGGGGITVVEVQDDGAALSVLSATSVPEEAGYLKYAPSTGTLYAVDERKTDGRGPVRAPASVRAFKVDQADGSLTRLNTLIAPAPFPTYLDFDEKRRALVCASHGSFDHVEQIVRTAEGWTVEYVYDDSAVLLYSVKPDGSLDVLRDVVVLAGHGLDPNDSPQAGGHGQASAHAHSAVIDPSARYVIVCDKGTDVISVFELSDTLTLVSEFAMRQQTGPRHLVFDTSGTHALLTCEFSSEVASLGFDPETGTFELIDSASSTADGFTGLNEPADLRLHPDGRFLYVNNRGEDSLAWFEIMPDKSLARRGHVALAKSLHPGLAARSFAFTPSADTVLIADRPAGLIRAYRVDRTTGALTELSELSLPDPAFIEFAELAS